MAITKVTIAVPLMLAVGIILLGCQKQVTEEWPSAENPVRHGDVEIHVKKVRVADSLLNVWFEIKNLSQTKKIEFETWVPEYKWAGKPGYASLKDNFGNDYAQMDINLGMPDWAKTEYASLYPGKTVRDELTFEQPTDTAEYLNLELPAVNFGEDGMLRLRIPIGMIESH